MFCSADSLSGVVHLAGPIQPSELEAITQKHYHPLRFRFKPRTTPPSMIGATIEEGVENTAYYMNKRYDLLSIQLASPLHKGYKFPGETAEPVAELVLTYTPTPTARSEGAESALLLCFAVYESSTPQYDEYLDQIVNDDDLKCGYENQVGKVYEGKDAATLQDSSLRKCVKACCDDTQCLAYTFQKGTCHIKHSVPNLLPTGDDTISGKIRREAAACAIKGGSTATATAIGLERLFYRADGTTTHALLSYPTCVETLTTPTAAPETLSLRVVVFPKGVKLRPATYQNLVLRAGGTLPPYRLPALLRGNRPTLLRYRLESGEKRPSQVSAEGELYATTVSTCTQEFERLEYFPRLPAASGTSGAAGTSEAAGASGASDDPSCAPRSTKQYKCMPFHPNAHLKGDMVTLDEVLTAQKAAKEATAAPAGAAGAGADTGGVEGIVAGSIGGLLLLYVAYRGFRMIFNRPS